MPAPMVVTGGYVQEAKILKNGVDVYSNFEMASADLWVTPEGTLILRGFSRVVEADEFNFWSSKRELGMTFEDHLEQAKETSRKIADGTSIPWLDEEGNLICPAGIVRLYAPYGFHTK